MLPGQPIGFKELDINEKRLVYTKISYVTYIYLCFPFMDFSSAFKLLLNENTIKLQYHKFPKNNVLLLPRFYYTIINILSEFIACMCEDKQTDGKETDPFEDSPDRE